MDKQSRKLKADRARIAAELTGQSQADAKRICEQLGLTPSIWSTTVHNRADNGRRIPVSGRVNLVVDGSGTVSNVFFG